MATPQFPVGAPVIYRHEGKQHRAQVTGVSDSGEVNGLAVYEGGPDFWHIAFGVTAPKLATTAQEESLDGYFWKAP